MSGHRLVLSRPVAERLLERAGARAPWPSAVPRAVRRLGPLPRVPTAEPDPDLALARLGALVPDPAEPAGPPVLHRRLVDALAPLRHGAVLVQADLVVPRPGGLLRLHSWQWPTADSVAALSTTGSQVELGWHDRAAWAERWTALASVVPGWSVTGTGSTEEEEEEEEVEGGTDVEGVAEAEVPAGLLVAGGVALRSGRPDLARVLAPEPRPGGSGCSGSGGSGSGGGSGGESRGGGDLHECRARLRVLVTGPTRAGLVAWVLRGAGWHAVTARGRSVRFTSVRPSRLGAHVERLVAGVAR